VGSLFDELKFRDPERARALSEALRREVEAAGRTISSTKSPNLLPNRPILIVISLILRSVSWNLRSVS